MGRQELAEVLAAEARVVRDADPRRKKAKKNKGRKRNGRRNGKGRRKSSGRSKSPSGRPRKSGRTVVDTCFETSIQYMKLWKDVVANFDKQNNRMTKQNKTGGNKSGKKGLFAPIAFKLVDIGGGNKTNMSCAGSTTSDGAKQLANLTKTLFDWNYSLIVFVDHIRRYLHSCQLWQKREIGQEHHEKQVELNNKTVETQDSL